MGGLALAAFEMAERAGLGSDPESGDIAQLGEDQARYLVACSQAQATALLDAAKAAGVPVAHGHFQRQDDLAGRRQRRPGGARCIAGPSRPR